MKDQFLHQGDCQLISAELPKKAKKIDKKPLAYGEHSGHQHCVTGDYELFQDDSETLYVSVGTEGALLQHIHESVFKGFDTQKELPKADHNVVKLAPGTYKVGIHKKYSPFDKVWQNVAD